MPDRGRKEKDIPTDCNIHILTSCLQTYRSYTHTSLNRLLKSEVRRFGWPAELFAGMPLWAARFALPIFRTQLFEPALQVAQDRLMSHLNASFDTLINGCFSIIRSSYVLQPDICIQYTPTDDCSGRDWSLLCACSRFTCLPFCKHFTLYRIMFFRDPFLSPRSLDIR